MNDKTIIETLAQKVKDNILTLNEIPETWRQKVQELLEGE